MTGKLEQIKQLVQENGTEKMKELVFIVEQYILGINHIFRNREVTQIVLQEFDFPLFMKELENDGKFENKCGLEIKVMVIDIYYLARHLWEFTDENGNVKTGDDLHAAWPLFFPDEKAVGVENIYSDLPYM